MKTPDVLGESFRDQALAGRRDSAPVLRRRRGRQSSAWLTITRVDSRHSAGVAGVEVSASVRCRAVGDENPGSPQLRVSDQDRDDVLQQLAAAVGDGRLTLDEYSGRADRALAARTRGELDRVLADLQAPAALPAQGPEELTAILGNQTRRGRWRVPARMAARSVLGDCHIELQDAVLTSPVTTIQARTTLGSVTIFVPEGVEVRLYGSAILGSHSSEVSSEPLPGAPVIQVQARAVLGSITVKRAGVSQRIRGALRDAVDRQLSPRER